MYEQTSLTGLLWQVGAPPMVVGVHPLWAICSLCGWFALSIIHYYYCYSHLAHLLDTICDETLRPFVVNMNICPTCVEQIELSSETPHAALHVKSLVFMLHIVQVNAVYMQCLTAPLLIRQSTVYQMHVGCKLFQVPHDLDQAFNNWNPYHSRYRWRKLCHGRSTIVRC